MINRKIDDYLNQFYKNDTKALLLTGARQTGKTFSVRQFAARSFERFVEVNFIDSPEAVSIFSDAKNSKDLLLRLSAFTSVTLVKGKTLIFFDEVQECPEIVTAIKFLVDEGSYRYILSGSLLGVSLGDLRSAPVGYMNIKEMFPLDFEEFVRALGINDTVLSALKLSFDERKPVDSFVHNKMMDLFRLYLIVGGMPAVVQRYIDTNNLQEVMEDQL